MGNRNNKLEHDGHIFEIVDCVPAGYQVWNIGKNMIDGYLPLCKLKSVQRFEGGRDIETDTLKAIKTDGAQIILSAVGGGQNTIESMERYIKRYSKSRPGTWSHRQKERMKEALKYMYQIKWC